MSESEPMKTRIMMEEYTFFCKFDCETQIKENPNKRNDNFLLTLK